MPGVQLDEPRQILLQVLARAGPARQTSRGNRFQELRILHQERAEVGTEAGQSQTIQDARRVDRAAGLRLECLQRAQGRCRIGEALHLLCQAGDLARRQEIGQQGVDGNLGHNGPPRAGGVRARS